MQVAKQLAVKSNVEKKDTLDYLRDAMGIMQHHDAITGTEQQHVAADYARLLNQAFYANRIFSSMALR